MRLARFTVAALLGALVVAGSATPMATVKLKGTVGPGFTITLKDSKGKAVKSLKAGKYSISVKDDSAIHNFRLKGPGVNKEITSVSFTGSKTVTLTLKKGKFTYVCDPHASSMKGSFTVK